jgi:hypothetical protein
MKWAFALAAAGLALCAGSADARPPLYDPVLLNIGLVCQWNTHCMGKQQKAMKRALKYVRKTDPPAWRIQQCNRNASRKRQRVDWVGYENCIRNAVLRYNPPPARPTRTAPARAKRGKSITQSEAASRSSGERG